MWTEVWARYKGRIVGSTVGFFLGLVYLFSGFWDMLIVAFIITIGFLIGNKSDMKQDWPSAAELWRWLMDRWSLFR
jgi:uncharacterized membrane protein